MGAEIGTQLITVGATLSGVVLTLVTNAYLERRRVRDARELESLRLESEQEKWLRDERVKAYAGLSLAGEEVLHFIRVELPKLTEPGRTDERAGVEARWRELRTELRKAYNQVELFGTETARDLGRRMWRIARNGGNDFLSTLSVAPENEPGRWELSKQLNETASHLGSAGEAFLDACRQDLQG
ncbi:MAG: hypothetical protein ACRDP6_35885 [Actinoallomurus sp.]